jgi:hypothetical protein
LKPADAGRFLATLCLQTYEGYVDGLAKIGRIDPEEAFRLAVFTVAWAAGHHKILANKSTSDAVFSEYYQDVYGLAVKKFDLDRSSFQQFMDALNDRFREYDPQATRAFSESGRNQFEFGDLMVGHLFGSNFAKGVNPFTCYLHYSSRALAIMEVLHDIRIRE